MKKLIAIVLIAITAFAAASCGAEKTETKPQSFANSSSRALSFTATTLDGKKIESGELFADKKVTMVNVWATYCRPCISEMPDIQKLSEELGKDYQVVGLLSDGYDASNIETGKQIVEMCGVKYLNFTCDVSIIDEKVSLDAVPTTFFVNEKGEIIGDVIVGVRGKDDYKKAIEAANG